MRAALICVVVAAAAATAAADPKIDKLVASYEREAKVCARNAGGIEKTRQRAQPLSETIRRRIPRTSALIVRETDMNLAREERAHRPGFRQSEKTG